MVRLNKLLTPTVERGIGDNGVRRGGAVFGLVVGMLEGVASNGI